MRKSGGSRGGPSAQVERSSPPMSVFERGGLTQDGAHEAGVWLHRCAKFGLKALVGLLRFHVDRGGKHVLSTFFREIITTILANH